MIALTTFKSAASVIPDAVRAVLSSLRNKGYEAYIVGGTSRALISGAKPKDWDISTNSRPEAVREILDACGRGFAEYSVVDTGIKHGSVSLIVKTALHEEPLRVDVTAFRVEEGYSDHRRPDSIILSTSIKDDLSRRDFTINAIALSWPELGIVDPFGGRRDLRKRVIRAVGDPRERFREDPLRMLRAVRFRSELGFNIERSTWGAIRGLRDMIRLISKERVRDEITRILTGEFAEDAVHEMWKLGLVEEVFPEFPQDASLFVHSARTMTFVMPVVHLRLAALLHDIGKPSTVCIDEAGKAHYYGHQTAGAQMAEESLKRLHFDTATITRVSLLIREHMFSFPPDITDAGIRRLIRRVGLQNVDDLIELRRADMAASGADPRACIRYAEWMKARIADATAGEAP
ncbi:MAG TPA: CCA tRNA nucleotidyltransferase, partial [Clostridia bacterium]|nr:CCA tRNA nucleotidyltransferase [Clostridia bacterium]